MAGASFELNAQVNGGEDSFQITPKLAFKAVTRALMGILSCGVIVGEG